MNESEFSELQKLSAELIWRVPLAFACVVGFFAFLAAVSGQQLQEGREAGTSRSHSDALSPGVMVGLRCLVAVAALRFCWVCAHAGDSAYYEISKVEAFGWLAFGAFILPLWSWHEKELM